MPLADQGDVEALMQRALTTTEAGYMPALLARADTVIYGALPDYSFTGVVNNKTATLRGSGAYDLWLPGRPIVNVDSVTVDGALLDVSEYEWFPHGDVHRVMGPLVWPRSSTIVVQWDYGLASPPGDIRDLAAELVRDVIVNPSFARQESAGQYSVTYAAAVAAVRLTDDHRRVLNRYRYPVPI